MELKAQSAECQGRGTCTHKVLFSTTSIKDKYQPVTRTLEDKTTAENMYLKLQENKQNQRQQKKRTNKQKQKQNIA